MSVKDGDDGHDIMVLAVPAGPDRVIDGTEGKLGG